MFFKCLSMIIRKSFHERIVILILFLEYVSPVKLPFKVVRKILLQCIYHIEIHPDVFVDRLAIATLRLPHPFGIVVHASARIQDNVTLFHRITLGVIEKQGQFNTAPFISSGAYIGTGAVILGGCVIGANAKVGANSIILKHVGDNVTAIGVWK